jgi:hypothetical protein
MLTGRCPRTGGRVIMIETNFPIPADDIRFPDAITIRHGSAPVLSRLFVAADNMSLALGIKLKFRNDFAALIRLNEAEVGQGDLV